MTKIVKERKEEIYIYIYREREIVYLRETKREIEK